MLVVSNEVKYLGVTINKSLSWNRHIIDRANKCKALLGKCRTLVRRSWGLTPAKLEWIYKAVVRPRMAYGSLVWAHTINNQVRSQLDKVQRLALLAITRPLRSTPTAGLEVLLGWPPLALHAQEMGLRTYSRIKGDLNQVWDGHGRGRGRKGHIGHWSKQEELLIPAYYPREVRTNSQIWIEKKETREDSMPIMIYTDASKSDDRVGYGWIASIGDYALAQSIFSAKEIDIFQAEMMAINEDALNLQLPQ